MYAAGGGLRSRAHFAARAAAASLTLTDLQQTSRGSSFLPTAAEIVLPATGCHEVRRVCGLTFGIAVSSRECPPDAHAGARQTSPAKFLVATCITNEHVSALLVAHCAMKGVTPPMPCMRVACAVVLHVNALCNMQY